MNFALAIAGIGVVYVLGTWIGVCISESRHHVDADRRALLLAAAVSAELEAEVSRWAGRPSLR